MAQLPLAPGENAKGGSGMPLNAAKEGRKRCCGCSDRE